MGELMFEQHTPRQTEAKGNPQRILLIVIALLGLILVGEVVYHLVVSEWLRINRIVVDSDLEISDERLLEISGLSQAPHYAAVDTAAVEERVAQLPAVQSVEVEKRFPNEISISVRKRTPLAISFAEEGSFPVVVDSEGVIFQWKEEVESLDLPVLSGLHFEEPTLGTRLPGYLRPFLEDLRDLAEQQPVLFRQFSEFRIVPTGERDFEVVVYPQAFDVPVRIEPRLDERTAKYIVMALDAFRRDGRLATIQELDFRGGEVVYRTREEQ